MFNISMYISPLNMLLLLIIKLHSPPKEMQHLVHNEDFLLPELSRISGTAPGTSAETHELKKPPVLLEINGD